MSEMPGDDASLSAYAGRWVARLRGKIIAHGATREAAELAARRFRHKEVPEVFYMPVHVDLMSSPFIAAVREVQPADVYLVGGAVRDTLLQRATHDLDFAVPFGQALKIAKKVADKLDAAFYPLDAEFDTGRVVAIAEDGSRTMMDFAGYRGADLEADLRGRDFTINAMALDIHAGKLIDPLGGAVDLREKRIRACTETSLSDDPVRILRAIRQAAALSCIIEPATRQMMKSAADLLPRISAERLRDELFKILESPRPDASIRAMEMLGILPILLPELMSMKGVEQSAPHVHDVWTHTLAVLRHLEAILAALAPQYDEDRANADLLNGLLVMRLGRYRQRIGEHLGSTLNTDRSARALLFFAALYHDVSKPETSAMDGERIRFLGHEAKGELAVGKRAMQFHLSNDEIDRVKLIVRHHMRIHFHASRKAAEGKEVSRKAIYRFFRDAGSAGVDLVLLSLADTRATYDHTLNQETWVAALDVCRTLLEAWWEKSEEIVAPPQLVNGNDLIAELKMSPGREIGHLLETIREMQAAGTINTREEALAFARGWLVGREEGKRSD